MFTNNAIDIFNKTKTRYKFDKDGNSYPVKEFLWQIYTPHKLRSSGISWYLSKGLPEYQVKKISGHSANSRAFYRYVAHADTEGIENQKNYGKLQFKYSNGAEKNSVTRL